MSNIFERRREAIEEIREEREGHRFERGGDRGECMRERREEHCHHHHDGREQRREERLDERHEERPQRYDQNMPHYAPPAGPPPGGLSRADFVSDDDFQRMMRSGEFETSRMGDGNRDRSRPPTNAGYGHGTSAYAPPPGPPGAHSTYAPGDYGPPPGPPGAYSTHAPGDYGPPPGPPGAYSTHAPGDYAPPPGPPGAYSTHAPEDYNPPPGPPLQYTSQAQARAGRGAASEYYSGPQPGQQAHAYSHIPDVAAVHSDSSNPALHQQYHEVTQGSHANYQTQQPYPSGEFDEEKYNSHFAAHAQAYGSDSDGRPMANDVIGAAAAVEALKITAANNQQSNTRPQQGGRPQGGFVSATDAQQSGRPSGGKPQGRPQGGQESGSESEDDGSAAKPQAPTGGGGPQDKIIALAMAQAGKLFDKKGGGDSQGKTQAMQTAAATAMRMMGEYKSTGKVNMQPGEMQKLMGLAMSLF